MSQEVALVLNESFVSRGGVRVTFRDIMLETIAANPEDPANYPAGDGVSVYFRAVDPADTEYDFHLTQLSKGYKSKDVFESEKFSVTLIRTESEYQNPRAFIRIIDR